MIEAAITITTIIITLLTGIYFLYKGTDNEEVVQQIIGATLIISSLFIGAGVYCFLKDNSDSKLNEPTALDVYRGKTTLQITYQDSIPIDSVVVFKDR